MSVLKPLLVLGIIISAIGFGSDYLGEYVGPLEYKGFLVFDYPEGENPIVNIVFTVDSSLADSLIIVNVPSIWSYSFGGGVLTLSGGSLSPGGSVSVTVSLNKYVDDGEYPVSSVGTTSAGEVSQASGPLLVGQLILLNALGMAAAARFPLAAILVGLGFLEVYLSRRKRVGPEDLQTGRMTEDTVYDTAGGITRVADDEGGEVYLRRDGLGRVIDSDLGAPDEGTSGDDDGIELHDDKGPTISTKDEEDEFPSTRTREQESTGERSRDGGSYESTTEDDGDDPRDIPPPTIYGEEIETDPFVAPVYIVSDFHIGSNKGGPGQVDKKLSNDMDKKTIENFLKWLDLVHKDATKYDHYDVVMNGDFLDLWQAARPKDDDYQKRLEDILETNEVSNRENTNFFSELGSIIRKHSPKCRFYYVIGNHDDPLYSGNHGGDAMFGEGNSFNSLRNMVTGKLRGGDTSLMSFAMNRQYTNANYKLFVEHGHQHDGTNMKDENGGPSGGQLIAQQINHMQEMDPRFENIEKTPNQETAKYLRCLVNHPGTPENIKDEIDTLKEISIDAEAYIVGNIVDFLLTDEGMSNLIIDRIDPENINRNELEEAREIIDDATRIPRRKIVVFGHTHLHDLQPPQPYSQWAYANSGTWLDDITYDPSEGCQLKSSPSKLPYVKISKEKGEDIALVELKFFKGNSGDRLVKVRLT